MTYFTGMIKALSWNLEVKKMIDKLKPDEKNKTYRRHKHGKIRQLIMYLKKVSASVLFKIAGSLRYGKDGVLLRQRPRRMLHPTRYCNTEVGNRLISSGIWQTLCETVIFDTPEAVAFLCSVQKPFSLDWFDMMSQFCVCLHDSESHHQSRYPHHRHVLHILCSWEFHRGTAKYLFCHNSSDVVSWMKDARVHLMDTISARTDPHQQTKLTDFCCSFNLGDVRINYILYLLFSFDIAYESSIWFIHEVERILYFSIQACKDMLHFAKVDWNENELEPCKSIRWLLSPREIYSLSYKWVHLKDSLELWKVGLIVCFALYNLVYFNFIKRLRFLV